jgi:hypothetical protein
VSQHAYFLICVFNGEPYDLCLSPNIIQVIKTRRKTWVGHIVDVGAKRNA